MRQATRIFRYRTAGPGLTEVTADLAAWVAEAGVREGLLSLLCRHSSASLIVQENASADARADLADAFDRLAPRGAAYRHRAEGPDDMPAHIRTTLSGVDLSIPVIGGRMALGVWQGVYLWEHRDAPHRREIAAHLLHD